MTNKRKMLKRSNLATAAASGGVPNDLVKFAKNYPMTRSKAKLLSSSKASPSVVAAALNARPKTRTKRLARKPVRPDKKARKEPMRKELTPLSRTDTAVAKRPSVGPNETIANSRKRKRAPAMPTPTPDNVAQQRTSARLASSSTMTTPSTSTTASARSAPNASLRPNIIAAVNLISSVPITYPSTRAVVQSSQIQTSTTRRLCSVSSIAQPVSVRCVDLAELKVQLKKATSKFNKACHQLVLLDQHMNDLQHSYSNSLENDRKTFKIVYRMQLATLEGTHNAYIEYIERQVERIKRLKRILFNNNTTTTTTTTAATSTATQTTAGGANTSASSVAMTTSTNTNNSNAVTPTASSSDTAQLSSVYIPIIAVDRLSPSAGQPSDGATGNADSNFISVETSEEDNDDDEDTDTDETDDDDEDDLFEDSSRLFAEAAAAVAAAGVRVNGTSNI